MTWKMNKYVNDLEDFISANQRELNEFVNQLEGLANSDVWKCVVLLTIDILMSRQIIKYYEFYTNENCPEL